MVPGAYETRCEHRNFGYPLRVRGYLPRCCLIAHAEIGRQQLQSLIQSGGINFAGNRKLKIYGLLTCSSGKRMKLENRVFFKDAAEARSLGFRPCGRCMREAFERWRKPA